MPIKVLFVSNIGYQQNQIISVLKKNAGIHYHIVNDFNDMCNELYNPNYTHVVSYHSVNEKCISDFIECIKIPFLIISENKKTLSSNNLNIVKSPLSYSKLFSFLCLTPILSKNSLSNFDDENQTFTKRVKKLIVEEFEKNLTEIPNDIKSSNLKGIRNKVHKMIGKFALLEMNESVEISREIDNNIIDSPQIQVSNVQSLLVDIEIALKQLN